MSVLHVPWWKPFPFYDVSLLCADVSRQRAIAAVDSTALLGVAA